MNDMPKELWIGPDIATPEYRNSRADTINETLYIQRSEYDLLLARCERLECALRLYAACAQDYNDDGIAREALKE